MEIRLSEKEITLGVVAFLNSRGMNIDPETANIEFSVSRKPAGVSAILHEGPIPAAEPEPPVQDKAEQKLVGQVAGSGTALDQAAEPAPEPVLEPAVDGEPEPVAQDNAEEPAAQTGASLFG